MAEEKKGFFKRLVEGLTKTRDSIVSGIDSIFQRTFPVLTTISMRKLRKSWSWATWESMQRRQLLRI